MARVAIIIALLSSFLVLGRSSMVALQEEFSSEDEYVAAVKQDAGFVKKGDLDFYPEVPVSLPNLEIGYLFNEARMLESDETEEGDEDALEAEAGEGEEVIDITNVTFIGSIISDSMTKALVSYQVSGKSIRRTRGRARSQPIQSVKYAHLKIGDPFAGYKVEEITPDKIVFAKGGNKVEKNLYDPSKKRENAPPIADSKPGTVPMAPKINGQTDDSVVVVGGGAVEVSPPQTITTPRPATIRRPTVRSTTSSRARIIRPPDNGEK